MHIEKAKLFHGKMAILSMVEYDDGILFAARRMTKNSKWGMYYSQYGGQPTNFAKAKRIKIKTPNKRPKHFVPGDFIPSSQTLYFTTASNNHLAIAKGHLTGQELTNIELLPMNNKEHNFAHPTLSSDGKTMIISSSIDGNMNLYQYHKDDTGSWNLARRILELESGYDEILPNLINDTTLVFSSNRDDGKGGFDLYLAQAESPDFWGEPTNLSEFNTANDEFSYFRIDSTSGYFTVADTIYGSTDFYYFLQ